MISWLVAILSKTDFLPHRFCIGGSVWLLSVSVLSNLLIFLAYFSIPLTLAYFLNKREQQVVKLTGWLFAVFIFACGITHLFHVITYWYPLYWVQACLDGLAAIVSVYTAIYLWTLLPKLLDLPNPEQLLKLNQQLQLEICERKAIEEHLQQEVNFSKTLINSLPGIFYRLDLNGRLVDWNDAFSALLGKEGLKIAQANMVGIIAEQHRLLMAHKIAEGFAKGYVNTEAELKLADGQNRCFYFTGKTLSIDNQLYLLGTGIDITERKLAEQQLQENDARLNALFENMGSGVVIYQAVDAGADFCFSGFNQAAEVIENISRSDILGKNLTEVFSDVAEIGFLGLLQRVWQTGVAEHFPLVFYQDAKVCSWRENYVYKLPSGEIVAIYDDVTELKQMEQSLHDSDAKFRHLLKMLPIPLAYCNAAGRIEYSNDRFQQLFGYNTEDIPTLKEWWLLAYPDEQYRQQVMAIWDEEQQIAVAEDRDVKPLEYEVTCKNGQVRVMEIYGINIEGNFLATFVDITARKAFESALQRSETKFRSVIETSPMPYAVSDELENITFINMAFIKTFGYEIEDIPTLTDWWQKAYPDRSYREWVQNIWQGYLQKTKFQDTAFEPLEIKIQCKDESVKTVMASMTLFGGTSARVMVMYDITERKQMEEKLHDTMSVLAATEMQNRLILDSAGEGIYGLDLQGYATFVNAASCKMLGYSVAEMQDQPIHKLIHHSYADGSPYPVEKCPMYMTFTNGDYHKVSGEVLWRKDGRCFPVDYTSTPIYFENQVIGAVVIFSDVSERVRAMQELEAERFRLSEIIRGTHAGTWEWNIQTGATVFNETWANMIGYSLEELSPVSIDTWSKYSHPDDLVIRNTLLEKHFSGELDYYQFEGRMKHKQGYWIWILDRGRISSWTEDGKPLLMYGTHQDITPKKQIEENLKESELMLKEAQEIAHLGHWILDVPSNVLRWSDEIYRIFGVLPQEFEATYQTFLDYVHPDDRSFVEYSYRCHLLSKTDYAIEYRILLKDGTIKHVSEKCKTKFSQKGQPVRTLGIVLDITERKQAVELLQEKTTALLRSNADLEQFAYSVSHDMRQPLRSVASHLQLLSRSLKDKIDEDERENLSFALDGAKRMDAMILSLLEYSRVGRKNDSKEWLSSRAILEDALEFLTASMQEMKVEIKITGEWGQILANEHELNRLFMNLISNAIKYREANQPPQIEIDSSVTEELWSVSVRDYGIGINPQQIDRLFQFFSRLQSRTRFEGTGMGLALCRRIVEHHDGRIWVESAGEGQGCCFRFELPIPNQACLSLSAETNV